MELHVFVRFLLLIPRILLGLHSVLFFNVFLRLKVALNGGLYFTSYRSTG